MKCCDFSVSCDQCVNDSICRNFLPGIAGFCYENSQAIAAFVASFLPSVSSAYALYLAVKKAAPPKDPSQSRLHYVGSLCSSVISVFKRIQQASICGAARSGGRYIKSHPGAIAASAASAVAAAMTPGDLQIPAACVLGLGALAVLKNGDEWGNSLKELFAPRPNESEEEFKKRRCSNLYRISLAVLGLGAMGVLAGLEIPQVIQNSTTYNIWIPFQNSVTAFFEYFGLGAAHALLAIRERANQKHFGSLFHLLAALSSLAFPIYSFESEDALRLHHFWIGQLLQIFPLLTLKLAGLFLSTDGWIQKFVSPGYQDYVDGEWEYSNFGCDNVVVDHFNPILLSVSLAVFIEGASKILFSQAKPEDKSVCEALKTELQKAAQCIKRTCCRPSEESSRISIGSSNPYVIFVDEGANE